MKTKLRLYTLQTKNEDGVWKHHSFVKPEYEYEEHTEERRWLFFTFRRTRQRITNEKEARIAARRKAVHRARRLYKSLPTRILISVAFREGGAATYEIWENGRFLV
jgi:hypothetical protein